MADTNTLINNPNAKDYDKYDFSGYELTQNDKGGYDWTDNSGNKHSLYSTDKNGSYHSITGADGSSNVYYQNGTRDNEYIRNLNKSAKKAYKAQLKAPRTGITQQAAQNLKTTTPTPGSQVIVMTDENGNSRKVGTSDDKNAKNILTGKSIANSFEAIANANVGDFWIDKDNNIHVVTDRDITYSKQMLNKNGNGDSDSNYSSEKQENTESQPRTTTPEENNGDENKKGSKERIDEEVENTRKLLQDPKNFLSNYRAILLNSEERERAEDALAGSEGKEKGIYGPTNALINGEFGNISVPKYGNKQYYLLKDTTTGEVLDDENGGYTKDQLKKLNKALEEERKKLNLKTVETEDGKYTVNDDAGPVAWFDNKEDAEKYRTGKGLYELSDVIGKEQHYVKHGDKKVYYDSASEATEALDKLKKNTSKERRNAWAQYLTHLGSGLGKGALDFLANAASWATSGQLVGDKFTGPSTWDKELNKRVEGNNELYYKNEEAKNDVVRKLMSMADSGMIDLNNLTNEQMATFIGTVGKENATQIINTIRKQELDKFMAMDYWKNWDEDQKNALSAWFAQSGQGPQTESMIALASGKVKPKDIANKWNTETKLSLAEKASTLQHLEKEVERIALENKLTKAQADVIKELVGEQLRSAKLTNDRQVQAMITDSASSLAKVIDAVVPF